MSAISDILLKNGTASLKDLYPLTKVNTEEDKKRLSIMGYNPGYTVFEWPYDLPVERVFYSNQLFPSTYYYDPNEGAAPIVLNLNIIGTQRLSPIDDSAFFLYIREQAAKLKNPSVEDMKSYLISLDNGFRSEVMAAYLKAATPSPELYDLFLTYYTITDYGAGAYDADIIIVPVKPTDEAADKEKSIVTKETLPEDTTEIPSDDYAEDGTVEKNQAKSRAIYFDDFVAKQETEFHVADLGDEKYSPECIKRLLQKNTAPAEGWIYLKGMAKLTKFGFTIFPEDWESNFGPSIYERESVKVDRRFEMSTEPQGVTIPYGWTVGLELPTQETVDDAIAELKAEMAG